MSDSGKQAGDCRHARAAGSCCICLLGRIDTLQNNLMESVTREDAARDERARLMAERTKLVEVVEQERKNRFESAEEWRAECARLKEQLAEHESNRWLAVNEHGDSPHDDPANCPTWYDYCNCTVDCLKHNIDRANKNDTDNAQLRAALAECSEYLKCGGNAESPTWAGDIYRKIDALLATPKG